MDKRIWKLIDTCIYITESLCCTPETNNIVNQLCSKKKKDVGKPAAGREQTWVLVSGWRTKQGKDQSRRALGVCRKGEGHYGVSWDLSKTGKEARTSVTQEGQERASRRTGFRHLHLKLVLLSSNGDNPSDSVCAAGIGSAKLQLGADWMRQWQDERASLTACGKEGYKLDIQALRAANSERSNYSLCLGGHIQGDVAPPFAFIVFPTGSSLMTCLVAHTPQATKTRKGARS